MKNGKFIEFITSVPFIIGAVFVISLVCFFVFIVPQQNYALNSSVLTKDSYIEINPKGNLTYLINANLFPEIKKKETFQKEISEEELQKALLRKEQKLLEEYKANPTNTQNLFDLGIWYLYTAGVRSDLNQYVEGRENRLLASYYYFKKFLLIDQKEKAISELTDDINDFINRESVDSIAFTNNLTLKLERDPDEQLTEQEEEQSDLLDYVIDSNEDASREDIIQNLEELCSYYKNNIDLYSNSRQLGFETATYYCYKDLSRYSDHFINQASKYKKKVANFNYSKK